MTPTYTSVITVCRAFEKEKGCSSLYVIIFPIVCYHVCMYVSCMLYDDRIPSTHFYELLCTIYNKNVTKSAASSDQWLSSRGIQRYRRTTRNIWYDMMTQTHTYLHFVLKCIHHSRSVYGRRPSILFRLWLTDWAHEHNSLEITAEDAYC